MSPDFAFFYFQKPTNKFPFQAMPILQKSLF